MKPINYFPHDLNARNDPKLVGLSMEGHDLKGLYWDLIEMMHEQGGYMPLQCQRIAFALRTTEERIKHLIYYPELFILEEKRFTSKRVLDNIKCRSEKSELARSLALKRWDAKAMPTQCQGNAIKKRKEKKSNIGGTPQFTPPLLTDVVKYCKERRNDVDPSKFHDFYSAKGWMVGKNKMKDWKAAVRTWEKGTNKTTKEDYLKGKKML